MIAIGNDHGGLVLKKALLEFFDKNKIEYFDFGTNTSEAVDYPDFAKKVADMVVAKEAELGILICGTGIGISIAANKVKGIRCALCHDVFSAKATRQHNDANILALGSRVIGEGLMLEIVKAFLGEKFEGGRHIARIEKIAKLEE